MFLFFTHRISGFMDFGEQGGEKIEKLLFIFLFYNFGLKRKAIVL